MQDGEVGVRERPLTLVSRGEGGCASHKRMQVSMMHVSKFEFEQLLLREEDEWCVLVEILLAGHLLHAASSNSGALMQLAASRASRQQHHAGRQPRRMSTLA